MKLIGKCLKDFEKWFLNDSYMTEGFAYERMNDRKKLLKLFYRQHPAEQFGVLVDFFDSKKFPIYINRDKDYTAFFVYNLCGQNSKTYTSRQQARKQAIIKACEIHNKKS